MKTLSNSKIKDIIYLCKANPEISLRKMALQLNVSMSSVIRHGNRGKTVIKCKNSSCNNSFIKLNNKKYCNKQCSPRKIRSKKTKDEIVLKYSRKLDDYWKNIKKTT